MPFVADAGATAIGNITLRIDPIPEPTTILLFGSGLVGLAGFRRRFKKRL
jgi:hypothetical protein